MRWTVPFPLFAADHLVPMARAAEANGFDTIAMPDSVFFPEQVSAGYPYTPDGSRFWAADTPFVDPFVGVSAMIGVTERIEFTTNVVKLPIRDPLLVAKQLSSMAVLSGNRVSLGVGLSWMPEEFTWTHTDMRTRGKRADEMIEILQLVCAGNGPEWVEYHGRYYDFDRLMISPAPDAPVPIIVGGLSEPGLRRAARLADGWISVQNTEAEITDAIDQLSRYRKEYGRDRPAVLGQRAVHRRVRPRRLPAPGRQGRHRAAVRALVLHREGSRGSDQPHRLAEVVGRRVHRQVLTRRGPAPWRRWWGSDKMGPCPTPCSTTSRSSAATRPRRPRSTTPCSPRSGAGRVMEFGDVVGYGAQGEPEFWLGPHNTGEGFRETHLALTAADRAAVRAFFDAAVGAGAEVLHEPRVWPEYHPNYYGAFVRDPDGNNVEAVCHQPE